MDENKLAYSIPETLRRVPVGRSFVYKAIRTGDLVARKCGRRTLILAEDLKRWLENLRPVNDGSSVELIASDNIQLRASVSVAEPEPNRMSISSPALWKPRRAS